MSEWKDYKLGDIVNFQNGFAFKSSEFRYDGKYKIIRIKELKNGSVKFFEDTVSVSDEPNKSLSKFLVNKGDVIFALTGDPVSKSNPNSWVGRVSLYKHNESAYLNQRTCKITQRGNVIPQYIFYYFRHYDNLYSLASKATGSASQANISTKTLEDTIIILPSLEVQTKIVNILSSLDEKIETNRKINARLEELAQALFKSWFIDFEPFGGKMPDDWELTPLSKVVDNIGGYSYKGDELQASNVAMVTIKNFDRNGSFKSDGFKEIVVSSKCKPEQHTGIFDVLVAHTDLTQNADIIGNPILILSTLNYDDLVYSMDLTKVVSKNPLLSNFIIYHILKTKDFKSHALGYVNGTTVLHMNKKAVPEYEIYLPKDFNVILPLHKALKPIYEQISVRLKEIEQLTSLRDSLLPKLMSGEIKLE